MENQEINFPYFYEKMKTEGFLYLPAECRALNCAPVFEEKNGSYMLKLTDGSEWLTEVPSLSITDIYESCKRRFDSENMKKILQKYVIDWQKAAWKEKKEQTMLAGLMEEFPEDKIFRRLIPGDRDRIRWKTYPGRFLGRAYLTYAVLLGEEEQKGKIRTIVITNAIQKKWNRKETALYEISGKNTETLFPYHFEEVRTPEGKQAYVISNEQRYFGVGTVLYQEGPLKELSMKLKEDLFVFPLSVHEAAVFPAEGPLREQDIRHLLKRLSPFEGDAWYYKRNLNKIAFTKTERIGQEAALKQSLPDAAERRMKDGAIR